MTEEKRKGQEYSFISSWEGWDEMDAGDHYFYDVELLPGIFPEEIYAQVEKAKSEGQKVDLGVYGQSSLVEVYVSGEEPIFTSKYKLVLSGE